jgi:tRNA (guanine37-N1)-methyltransferase
MLIDVLTLFPRLLSSPLEESILGKAIQRGLLRVRPLDVRDFAEGKHRVTDDLPYGGGAGMVMKPEPLTLALERSRRDLEAETGVRPRTILLSPQGVPFTQAAAQRLAGLPGLTLVCGRYEGVDERVLAEVDEELSLGDFVLTGGELAALCVIDAVARLLPGVLGNAESARTESFAGEAGPGSSGAGAAESRPGELLLEGPQYTRPPEFRGRSVPPVLLSGDHARIARWRRRQALLRTRERRPELFRALQLSQEDRVLLANESEAL